MPSSFSAPPSVHASRDAGIATLVLDASLRLMRYSRAADVRLGVRPADHGRPLADLDLPLVYDDLAADAARARDRAETVEREVDAVGARCYRVRMQPRRDARTGAVVGVTLTCADVTRLRCATDADDALAPLLCDLVDASRQGACLIEVLYDDEGQPVDHRILVTNDAFEQQTGLANAAGRRQSELIPNLSARWVRAYHRVATTRTPEHLTWWSDAMARHVEVEVVPVGDPGQAIVGLLLQDVTERQRAKAERQRAKAERRARHEALEARAEAQAQDARLAEAHYRSLFDAISEGFCVVEILYDDATGQPVDHRFLEVNPAFMQQSGLDDPTGATARTVMPDLEPRWFQAFARVAATGTSEQFAAYADTLGRWFEVDAFRLGTAEEARVGILFRDITDRRAAEEALRESEARLRSFANTAPAMLWVCNAEGACTFLNQGWYDYTGQTEAIGLGFGWLDAVHPDDRQRTETRFREASEARTSFRLDYRLRRHDGAYRWVIDAGHPRFDADGNFRGYVGSVIDIHDRKKAETELQALNETLEARVDERTQQVRHLARELTRAEQAERRRISQILHDDLQQMLYGVEMRLHLLRDDLGAEASPQAVEEMDEMSTWLQEAITLSRRLTVDLSPPVLKAEGLDQMLAWLAEQMHELHGLTVHLQAEVPGRVRDDDVRVLLFQIVRELLFNTKKHAGVSEATVRLTRDDAHRVVVHVSDAGQGFDVEAAEARNDGGFGLFSVRERLRLMGGHLNVHSSPGHGTQVTVYAPPED